MSVIGSVWTFLVRIDKLPVLVGAIAGIGLAIWLTPKRTRTPLAALLLLLAGYAVIHITIWRHGARLLEHPPERRADAALILGNRAYRDGRPNPCLTGRVDAGIALASTGAIATP